jgi:hypothetical protein
MSGATNNGVSSSSSTGEQLRAQWSNPSDVLSVLLIIGGDIVRTALAQTSGGKFTPVCFSFGWVAYSLTALISVVGEGRLLPPPDYPAKVFNLSNGYTRENKSWVIGRLLRDNEVFQSRDNPIGGNAIRISVYEARDREGGSSIAGHGRVRYIAFAVMCAQLGIAFIPVILYREWGVLMITGAGTLLAVSAGALPQWSMEKLPNKTKTTKNFAITSGNGSRDVMVVLGLGKGLDLEELANSETPRSNRLWEGLQFFSKPVYEGGQPKLHGNSTPVRHVHSVRGIPLGYWVTLLVCSIQSLLWLGFLITVAGLRSHTWYLLIVGCLGMFQNATTAAIARDPVKRCLPLKLVDTIITRKVMDGLMDLEFTYESVGENRSGDEKPHSKKSRFGYHLRKEFFPGPLREDEEAWWNGDYDQYDDQRLKNAKRGPPRTRIGRLYNLAASWDRPAATNHIMSMHRQDHTFQPRPPIDIEDDSSFGAISPLPSPRSGNFMRTDSTKSQSRYDPQNSSKYGKLRETGQYESDVGAIGSPSSSQQLSGSRKLDSTATAEFSSIDGVSGHDFAPLQSSHEALSDQRPVKSQDTPQTESTYELAPSPVWV